MEPINVLSLFDGMSCGQIALERAYIPVANYYASEIDKYAISVTQYNYPNTTQLGSVTNWREWLVLLPKIDLIIAGSPCQGFSVASPGRLNFEDPRSKLFFTFCDILAVLHGKNPDLKFFLENVKMKKEWRDIISDRMKVEPILINSALVSAQNRERYYWANFPITQPEDKGILLKDIIEEGEVDRSKSYAIDANYFKGGSSKNMAERYFSRGKRQIVKTSDLHQSERRLVVKTLGHGFVKEDVEVDPDKYAALCAQSPHTKHMIRIGTANDVAGHDYNKRVYSQEGKGPALAAKSGGNLEPKVAVDDSHWRKLTVLECERLQTVPEGYTGAPKISNTQRYKMLGNGWTVDVIAHAFRCAYGETSSS